MVANLASLHNKVLPHLPILACGGTAKPCSTMLSLQFRVFVPSSLLLSREILVLLLCARTSSTDFWTFMDSFMDFWSSSVGLDVDRLKLALHVGPVSSSAVFMSVMLLSVVTIGRKWWSFSCSWQWSHCWYCNSMVRLFYRKCLGPPPHSPSTLLPPAALQELCWHQKCLPPASLQKENFLKQRGNQSRRICLVRMKQV